MSAFEAVVIGASAGGIEALGEILPRLPAGFPLAVAVVLHLPPKRASLLPEIFAARCRLPVREACDKEPVAPGVIYFAPPDYHLLIEPDRSFALSQDEPVYYSRPAVDVLFESAALAYRDRLLGILLTGASADGAAGMAAIRRCGGQTWAQDPAEAKVNLMPSSAIDRGVHRVGRLGVLAADLAALAGRDESGSER